MKGRKFLNLVFLVVMIASLSFTGIGQGRVLAQDSQNGGNLSPQGVEPNHRLTNAERQAAANRAAAARYAAGITGGINTEMALAMGTPDYFGTIPNWANSPFPPSVIIWTVDGNGAGAAATATITGGAVTAFAVTNTGQGYTVPPTVNVIGGGGWGGTGTAALTNGKVTSIAVAAGGSGYGTVPGIRKFVDTLPGLGAANANDLGQYIPVAIPDTTSYPGADYYVIELGRYTEQLHKDLPATQLEGYRQTNTTDPTVSVFSYLGPIIVAQKDRPVRVKFVNNLPTTANGGNLFIPVDTTIMGAGMGPDGMNMYSQNRATLHLHGGDTPWISDGTPHQWTTPAGENSAYPEGVSVYNVPDMDGGSEPVGTLTFYYTNQQSARLMFYHDHAYGITRLNVYAGEAAGYILRDTVEQNLITTGVIPTNEVPLVIQDKTFVPSPTQLAAEDPTWDLAAYGGYGNLWFPHVYMPNQNPYDIMGANAVGRWDYGPWFWPPFVGIVNGPVPNPLFGTSPTEGPDNPGTPNPSLTPEAFMDTPLVNGTAYPSVTVQPTAYRLRILNACNDRNLNLQFYQAKSNAPMWDPATGALLDANAGEVNMVPAIPDAGLPPLWPTDGRDGGVPDPAAIGPTMEQIGTEGGFLPAVAELPNTPVGYEYNRRNIVVLNVTNKTLFLGPAERADVVVDFSQFAGKTIILYNDAPAPVPAFDSRIDYYTGDPDQTMSGGAPSTQPGYGPNTRTIMQIKVASVNPAGDAVSSVSVAHGGQDYTVAPTVAFSGGGGTGAVAATTGSVFDVAVLNPGSGYASPPAVVFSGGGGTGAAADAIVTNGFVTDIVVTNPGSGYTSAPSVALNGGGTGATANASLTVSAIAVTAGGSGYTSVPNVLLMGGGGYGATAIANLALGTPFNLAALQAALPPAFAAAQPAPIVPQAGYNAAYNANYPVDSFVRIQDTSFSFFNGPLTGLTITNAGSGYTTRPSVSITGGGGTGATASAYLTPTVVANITLLTGGSGYTVAPLVKLNGGGGTGAAALATLTGTSIATVSVTARGSGYTSPPQVGFVGGGGSGATAHATIRNGGVQSVVVDTHGTGYIVAPTVTFTGGGGSGATATARLTPTSVASVALTSGGSGYTTAPAVAFSSGGGGTGATAKTSLVPTGVKLLVLTNPGTGYTSAPAVAITGGGGTGATAVAIGVVMGLGPKAIQELFEVNYGRMNAILGAEVPNTTGINQTTIPYNYIDPPNEILKAGDPAAPIGTLADGTQIWKITHNGVDTHAIHFHMFNVQLINRVGWDGMVTPPDANELGWKDTVRMHPLQDAIVAIRPIKPNVPWDLPNSIRLLDPTMPAGSLVGFTNVDPTAQPAVTTNSMVNFGWEYVWHCHLLGHEENDMMRPMIIGVAPIAPSKPTAVVVGAAVKLTWLDKSMNETAWTLQRQDGLTGPWINVATVPGVLGSGSTVTYTDTTVVHLHTYYYRLIANNVVGYTQTYTAPAVGWPHPSFDSGPTARSNAVTP